MLQLNDYRCAANLVADPEIKTMESGKVLANIRLAVNRSWKKPGATEYTTETLFISGTAWEKTADYVGKYLKKGDQVYVEGSLRSEEWEKDGVKRSTIKIRIQRIQSLKVKPKSETADEVVRDESTGTTGDAGDDKKKTDEVPF